MSESTSRRAIPLAFDVQLPPDSAPAIPAKVRTVAYFAGLGIGAATVLVTGVVAAVAPDAAVMVLAVCGAVSGAASLVLGGLGVAFRPTVVAVNPVRPQIEP